MARNDDPYQSASDDGWGAGPQVQSLDSIDDEEPASRGGPRLLDNAPNSSSCVECQSPP